MQRVGNCGDQLRRIPERESSLFQPDGQIVAFDEFRHDEAKSVFRATHIEYRHDVRMVQLGENTGFNQKCFYIFGVKDSFRVWHLDGDRAVEVIVMSQIDPSARIRFPRSSSKSPTPRLALPARSTTRSPRSWNEFA